ncbi:MAG TPA: helix-hairpin-helix domain-containing protein, partial [Thermoanaerobaculia bacterium]|nr:helix-hairpin-helix domain-containing protein [Thermoanaerobaculia bacterium]
RVSVTSDEQAHRPHLDVIVDNDQLSLAIGKKGLNVRLAAELISAKIDIKSEEEVKGEVADALSAMLQAAMAEARAAMSVREIDDLDPAYAELLEAAGYDDLESILNASVEDLTQIEGIEEEAARQIIEIARQQEALSLDEEDAEQEYDGEEGEEEEYAAEEYEQEAVSSTDAPAEVDDKAEQQV